MKCTLAPELKSFFHTTYKALLTLLVGILCVLLFILAWVGIAYMIGTTTLIAAPVEFIATILGESYYRDPLSVYLTLGNSVMGAFIGIIVLPFCCYLIFSLLKDCFLEHYYDREQYLRYKYNKPIPWWKIYLSYIIVCKVDEKD